MSARFEARKNQHGAWVIFIGDVHVVVCASKKVARAAAAQMNESTKLLAWGAMMPAGTRVSSGAATALIDAKRGESSDLATVAYSLWTEARKTVETLEEAEGDA